ncbi:hypothetical protein [Streptomyces curacoi]|uniref:Uncharacterized protein n=1 Tax=Streptomyces curacoi TaxID=146536 RepID=A0A124H2J6_9ACTN|nr:hypothetical protein [Streptomyces curacoi]KUM76261.1 hypothetical protein AQI70_14990 [Streptomyces curacoi]
MSDKDTRGADTAPEHMTAGEEADGSDPVRDSAGGTAARADLLAMHAALTALEPLDRKGRTRVLVWLADALEVEAAPRAVGRAEQAVPAARTSSAVTAVIAAEEEVPSPREFVSRKRPASNVERVACLAYYLGRYRSTPHFRTPDIVDLNTESAGPKFGNPSRDVDNADRGSGFLVTAGKGTKQLSTRGEALVEALPDREAVKAALREHPYRPRKRGPGNKKPQGNGGESGE